MSDSGRGEWELEVHATAVSFACNRGRDRVILVFCCWFVAKNMSGSMVGAVC